MMSEQHHHFLPHAYVAGWENNPKLYHDLFRISFEFPEVFGDANTEEDMANQTVHVNSEGNFHLFIFRPASKFEMDQNKVLSDPDY